MFGIQTLRVFVAVAETGGIRGAAERLSRTPSAISMSLKQLEGDVGAPLFEKERKNALTPLGRVVFDEGRDLLAHYERSRATIDAIARNESTRTELACTPSVAVSFLPDVVSELARLARPVRVRARDMDSRTLSESVAAGVLDVGIGHMWKPPIPGLSFTPLFTDRLAIVCSKACPLSARRGPLRWEDVKEYPFLAHGSYGEIEDPVFAGMVARAHVQLPSAMALYALIRANVGITVLSRLLERQGDTDICYLPLKDPKARQVVGIISRQGHNQSPATTAFITTLQRLVRENRRQLQLGPVPGETG